MRSKTSHSNGGVHHAERRLMTLLNRVQHPDPESIAEALSRERDWNYIYETSCLLGVAPLYYCHLKRLSPPGLTDTPVMDAFRRQYLLSAANSLRLLHEFDGIAEKLSQLGIPCMALKGVMLARVLYPVPALRPMFDIDILVKKEDLQGVDAALGAFAYRPMGQESPRNLPGYQYHLHYQKEAAVPVILEVHWGLGEQNRYDLDASQFWLRAQKSAFGPHLEMSDDDALLYLCLHFFKHFLFKRLSWLCDIYEWIGQKEIHWDQVIERARSQSIATFLAYTLIILEDFYGMDLPLPVEQILRVGILRKKVLGHYLRAYDMFHPMNKSNWLVQRLFAFSSIDCMSGRLKFTWNVLKRDLG